MALPASARARGIGPLILLFGLIGLYLAVVKYHELELLPPPPVHQSDKGRRLDPWRPLPGCILLAEDGGMGRPWAPDASTVSTCRPRSNGLAQPAPAGLTADEGGFAALLRATAPLRTPLQVDPGLPMAKVVLNGQTIPTGAALRLTINAKAQARADRMLACLSGQTETCRELGVAPDTWQHHYENAAFRAGALLVLDIASGRIEVAVSRTTSCYASEEGGLPITSKCPPSARELGARPWKLANAALFADEMPGSLVKLPIILALLRHPETGPGLLRPGVTQDKFIDDIRHSETPNFLDRLFCRDRGYIGCDRIVGLEQAASDLGWNQSLGNLVALHGAPAAVDMKAHSARFLRTSSGGTWRLLPTRYKPERARRCAEQAKDHRWSKCRDEAVANLVAELWGQGNARISPLAVAATLARIGAASNRLERIGTPHLLMAADGDQVSLERDSKIFNEPVQVAPEHADLILKGMSFTHQNGGTAFTACLHALGNGTKASQGCAMLKGVAGKTGTPVFNHDRLTVTERARECAELRKRMQTKGANKLRPELTQCQVAPLKWYAAVVRENPLQASGPWSKVIVALAERNWRRDGRIDSSLDRGPNIAAEMVFRYLLSAQGNTE